MDEEEVGELAFTSRLIMANQYQADEGMAAKASFKEL